MSRPTQKQLVRQEISEAVMLCMDELVCFAGDLESLGDTRHGEDVRSLAGTLENFALSMREWT